MRAVAPPPPAVDDPPRRALVLRDGTVATRAALDGPADREAMRRFFHELSPESRRRRFFTAGEPADALVDRLLRLGGPNSAASRWSRVRQVGGDAAARSPSAPISRPATRRRSGVRRRRSLSGQGPRRRCCSSGSRRSPPRHGFRRFEATTLADNAAMLEVFRDSGFEVRSKSDRGCVDVSSRSTPSARRRRVGRAPPSRSRPPRRCGRCSSRAPSRSSAPRAIQASIGRRDSRRARRRPASAGRSIRSTRTPTRSPACAAYASVARRPGAASISAIVAVPRDRVLDVVDDCAAAGVKSLVVITAGFAEAGDEGRALQQRAASSASAATACGWSAPTAWACSTRTRRVRLNASFSPIFPPSGRRRRCRRRAARSGWRFSSSPPTAASACRRSSASATRPTSRATICCEYWEADPTDDASSCCISSRSGTRAGSRGWRGASAARSRSSP